MRAIREPADKDLMPVTRYAIEHARVMEDEKGTRLSQEQLRERKYWAADQLFSNDTSQRMMIAEQKGEVIGYIFGIIDNEDGSSPFGSIKEIFVDEFYRREGVGTELCSSFMNWMENQGVNDVRLDVLHTHPRAKLFFCNIGFISKGDIHRWNPDGKQ